MRDIQTGELDQDLSEQMEDEDTFSFTEMLILFAQILPMAILFALIVRTFIFQSFFIPSASMVPSLQIGDHLFVSKYSYGYSRYSLPYNYNLFSGRILSSLPQRGDVAVFSENETHYVKRVMGLPGDKIQVINAVVHINGKPVKLKKINDALFRNNFSQKRPYPQFEETLPNNVTHLIIETMKNGSGDNTKEFLVPANHYFMMGDNRDGSSDSRYQDPIGFIALEKFVGKAQFVYFSLDRRGNQERPFWEKIRWSRIFKWIL